MYLQKLSLLNFKNYEETTLDFDASVNVLVGRNGSGKTNLLDAIYYLSFTKSAFSSTEVQCIRNGEQYFMVRGHFQKGGRHHEVVASVQSGVKKIFREDQVDYGKLSDHIGRYPAVLIAPDDTDLIREGSELRRKFFDGIISQLDGKYLNDLMQYQHTLRQRNALLKLFFDTSSFDLTALETYDAALIRAGSYIYSKRKAFIDEFVPAFYRYFNSIVEDAENPVIEYTSGLNEVSFQDGLMQNRQRDQLLQRTGFGIHKDDFIFRLADIEIKRSGSQGQQKSFVLALKLAQYHILEKEKGFKPLLLLDDIFDKLDDFRITALLELMKTRFGQIFITDARPHRTSEILNNIGLSAKKFVIDHGVILETAHL